MDTKDQIFWGIDEQRRLNLKEEIPNVWEKIKSNEITNENFKITVTNGDNYQVIYQNRKNESFQKKDCCWKIV